MMLDDDRSPDEIARWKKRDPVTILGRHLEELGHQDGAAVEAVEAAIAKELEDSFKECEATPYADAKQAFTNVYRETIENMGL